MRTWLKRLGAGVAAGLVLIGMVFLASTGCGRSLGGRLAGERLARAEKSPHFKDGKFVNAVPTSKLAEGRGLDTLTRAFTVDYDPEPRGPVPVVKRTARDFTDPPSPGLEVAWMGHSTSVVDLEGYRVMTDPMLSRRASPVSWAGPGRLHDEALSIADMPPIDFVVVSHDHYDHLDMATVEALAARKTVFVLPLGIGAHLEAWDVPANLIVELDWWESYTYDGLTIHCVPARHYSGRAIFDQDEALWAGWVLKGRERAVYYSGDTGFSGHFAEVGERFGPFDLTLIKVGAYDETWPDIHINPEEAVRAHVDVRGQLLLPVHWGTFNLGYHDWDEPIRRVVKAANEAGVRITTPRPGERVVVGETVPTDPWWEAMR